MSLFIAGQAFPNEAEFTAAKVAIFLASVIAGGVGALVLSPRARVAAQPSTDG
jgi:NhaA family Na+:H+ antiporter